MVPTEASGTVVDSEYFRLAKNELRTMCEGLLNDLRMEILRLTPDSRDGMQHRRQELWVKGIANIKVWGEDLLAAEASAMLRREPDIGRILHFVLQHYVQALHPSATSEEAVHVAHVADAPPLVDVVRCYMFSVASMPYFASAACLEVPYDHGDGAFIDALRTTLYRLAQGRVQIVACPRTRATQACALAIADAQPPRVARETDAITERDVLRIIEANASARDQTTIAELKLELKGLVEEACARIREAVPPVSATHRGPPRGVRTPATTPAAGKAAPPQRVPALLLVTATRA